MSNDDDARKKEAAAFFAFLEENRKDVEKLPVWMRKAHGIDVSPRRSNENETNVEKPATKREK